VLFLQIVVLNRLLIQNFVAIFKFFNYLKQLISLHFDSTQPFFEFIILLLQIVIFRVNTRFCAYRTSFKMLFVIKVRYGFAAFRLILAFKLELFKLSHNVLICIAKKNRTTSSRTLFILQRIDTLLAVKHGAAGSCTFERFQHNSITNGAFVKFKESLQVPLICRHK